MEPSGPVQAGNGIDLPLPTIYAKVFQVSYFIRVSQTKYSVHLASNQFTSHSLVTSSPLTASL
jgi:hypothetical protein